MRTFKKTTFGGMGAAHFCEMGAAHTLKGAALNPPKVAPLETVTTVMVAIQRSKTILHFYPPSTAAAGKARS